MKKPNSSGTLYHPRERRAGFYDPILILFLGCMIFLVIDQKFWSLVIFLELILMTSVQMILFLCSGYPFIYKPIFSTLDHGSILNFLYHFNLNFFWEINDDFLANGFHSIPVPGFRLIHCLHFYTLFSSWFNTIFVATFGKYLQFL